MPPCLEGDRMMAYMDSHPEEANRVVTVRLPGNEVIDFLREHGAEESDRAPDLETGGRPAAVASHRAKIEAGLWEETDIPIRYNEETGVVGPGADRVAALIGVDWAKAPWVPEFSVKVKHFNCYGPPGGAG
jgi:hypothetical protein